MGRPEGSERSEMGNYFVDVDDAVAGLRDFGRCLGRHDSCSRGVVRGELIFGCGRGSS